MGLDPCALQVQQTPNKNFCSPLLSHTEPILFFSTGTKLQYMLKWAWIHVQVQCNPDVSEFLKQYRPGIPPSACKITAHALYR